MTTLFELKHIKDWEDVSFEPSDLVTDISQNLNYIKSQDPPSALSLSDYVDDDNSLSNERQFDRDSSRIIDSFENLKSFSEQAFSSIIINEIDAKIDFYSTQLEKNINNSSFPVFPIQKWQSAYPFFYDTYTKKILGLPQGAINDDDFFKNIIELSCHNIGENYSQYKNAVLSGTIFKNLPIFKNPSFSKFENFNDIEFIETTLSPKPNFIDDFICFNAIAKDIYLNEEYSYLQSRCPKKLDESIKSLFLSTNFFKHPNFQSILNKSTEGEKLESMKNGPIIFSNFHIIHSFIDLFVHMEKKHPSLESIFDRSLVNMLKHVDIVNVDFMNNIHNPMLPIPSKHQIEPAHCEEMIDYAHLKYDLIKNQTNPKKTKQLKF